MKKKRTIIIIVTLLLAFTAYIQSPTAGINKNQVLFYSETTDDAEVSSSLEELYGAPILEYKLEDTQEVDGFLIETYREYEIYKDKNGEVVKTVATDHTQFLQYAK